MISLISSRDPFARSALETIASAASRASLALRTVLKTVSREMASHTPALAISTYASPSGKDMTVMSGMGLTNGAQSRSPSTRAQVSPPGKARSGPAGCPSLMACPSLAPNARTRVRSALLSARRCSRVRGTEGNLSAAGLAGKRKAAEVPTCPVVSSPRVSLIRQTVAVVPDVC